MSKNGHYEQELSGLPYDGTFTNYISLIFGYYGANRWLL